MVGTCHRGWLLVAGVLLGLWSPLGVQAAEPADGVASQAKDPDPKRFEKSIVKFGQDDQENPDRATPTVFVGSSSIRLWDIDKWFPKKKYLNRGFGGAHISDIQHYADQVLLKYKPTRVVFFCGGNDLAGKKPPEQVIEDFQHLMEKLWAVSPKAKVWVIAIKPSKRRWNMDEKIRTLNKKWIELCRKDDRLTFLDIYPKMLGPDGMPNSKLFRKDNLHLSEDGYKIWSEMVTDALAQAEKSASK